ncbi:polyprenyl synthetase family protein [Streptomyces zingiberis]|uniref:Polyprenyl synthetase family protein n=1 Tax=Streptomyces zingiberis TaxID=2053010 RepID=A0ABX1BTT0_9ACTN|nr:polyprenyl synthetase family protein [Streptomyces zingiberis]NJQ01126.1 polyprenyl synthetase family protein [Streptomyces zingiberis]
MSDARVLNTPGTDTSGTGTPGTDTSGPGAPGPAAHTPDPVPDLLAECREAVLPALRRAVDRLHPRLALISSYHFGWCGPDGRPARDPGGKMLRATLVTLTARAFGAGPAEAVPGAVAAELVHNFSLLHDDLMDADELRRGRPSAWVVFGAGPAVLAGDALLNEALRTTAEVPGAAAPAATRALAAAVETIIRGQAADLELDGRDVARTGPDDYLAACAKTSGLLSGCAEVAAALAGAPAPAVSALRSAAWDLGIAWQMADDLENLWGDTTGGKHAYGDLRRGKRTYPVIVALRSGTRAGSRLAARLGSAAVPGEGELAKLADLVAEAGGRAGAERDARHHLGRALRALEGAGGDPAAMDDLTALFRHVLGRHERWLSAGGASPGAAPPAGPTEPAAPAEKGPAR